jgi:anti-sigma factor RsiW
MSCYDESRYALFLDKELGSQERQEIEEHIYTCNRCREQVQRMEAENARLEEAFASRGTPDLVSVVMARLKTPAKTRMWPRLVAAAASVLVAALLFFFLFYSNTLPENGETDVLLCNASVEGEEVQGHIYTSKEPDIQFIWLEKDK